MKAVWLIVLMTLSLTLRAQKVKIAAAADLRYAMDEIVKAYKNVSLNTDIEVIYGSSGHAYTQIVNGAPFDIYFSADILYPQKLKDAGLAANEPTLYAIGRIVLWSSSLDVSKGLSILTSYPKMKISTANPDHAPYGARSVEALKYYKLYDKVEKQLIFGENISQAAQFCLTGNAEVGLLALSIAMSPAMSSQGNYFLIDEKSHSPLEQAYIVLKKAEDNLDVAAFIKFIASKPARAIFEKYGFALPSK